VKCVKVEYHGAVICVPYFLERMLPEALPLQHWPTFCGAGNGFGDRIVPDWVKRVCISPECFVHDIDWAIADGSWRAFQAANNRFLKNLISRFLSVLNGMMLVRSLSWAVGYWFVVSSPVGWLNYCPCGKAWDENPVVREKLHRLIMAEINYCSGTDDVAVRVLGTHHNLVSDSHEPHSNLAS
jgi:hypothetical protein